MAPGNFVAFIGNATGEPELRFTASGQAVASFSLAVNRRWQNRQTQEWEEATTFVEVTAWGQLAENASQSMPKGCRVMVEGRLDQDNWETKEGDKRSKLKVTADEIGISLKFATAVVEKNERREPVSQSGGSSRSDYDPDEKPF